MELVLVPSMLSIATDSTSVFGRRLEGRGPGSEGPGPGVVSHSGTDVRVCAGIVVRMHRESGTNIWVEWYGYRGAHLGAVGQDNLHANRQRGHVRVGHEHAVF
eukprot:3195943-Rhodomonas_salina.1